MSEVISVILCPYCGILVPHDTMSWHVCHGSTTTTAGWKQLPDDINAGKENILSNILAELRQIRVLMERRKDDCVN